MGGGGPGSVPHAHSAEAWATTERAAAAVGLTVDEMRGVREVLAGVVHLREVRFTEQGEEGLASVASHSELRLAAVEALLALPKGKLRKARNSNSKLGSNRTAHHGCHRRVAHSTARSSL